MKKRGDLVMQFRKLGRRGLIRHGLSRRGLSRRRFVRWTAAMTLLACMGASAQTAYEPKFKGYPAKSESEAAALGYMRTVLRAQKTVQEKERQVRPNPCGPGPYRIVYQAHGATPTAGTIPSASKPIKTAFDLTMTPKQLDAEHRSFYAGRGRHNPRRRSGPGK